MDVLALFQHGVSNSLATLGTASNILHLEKIFRHTGKLVVCFDGDEAGKKAAQRLLETALPAMRDGREILFLYLPAGEDPDSFIQQQGKAAFLYAVEKAVPLEQELFNMAEQGISLDSEAGKARFVSQALPLLKQLPDGVFKQRMLNQLADRVEVTASSLEFRTYGHNAILALLLYNNCHLCLLALALCALVQYSHSQCQWRITQ